jgi:hydroxymethylglutaryl-CoA reductase
MTREVSSRIAGFYKCSVPARLELLVAHADLDPEARRHLEQGGGLPVEVADKMSENVIAVHGLPLGVGLNFRVNGRDVLVPMAVEEPSVVAAASNAAKMVRAAGGFHGEADPPVMTAQVQFDAVPEPEAAAARVRAERARILMLGDAAIPRMVARGGGCRDLDARVLDAAEGVLVVDVFVDVGDAMGANLVDTVAEALAPALHELVGGTIGLRILSNLPLRRMVQVRADVDAEAVGGAEVADGIARASRFAELDPFRAVTHNKGFMNGLDAAAVALGQDWRSIEAAAHAYAALSGTYRPLSVWKRTARGLAGSAALPLAVGTVGGSTRAHAGVRAAFQLARVASARELAVVLAAVGLASNLAALRALASEGIQKGHMKLHHRKREQHAEPAATELAAGPARAGAEVRQ